MGLTEKCQIRTVFIGSCSCVDCDKCKKYNDSEFLVECDYLTKQYREKNLERICK